MNLGSGFESHPAADVFPMLPDKQLRELAEDIRARGLREAILVISEGEAQQVLDGRNRLLACRMACVEPRFRVFNGDDPFLEVISLNVQRRHLTPSQRAMCAARAMELYRSRAKARQSEAGGSAPGNISGSAPRDARDEAGDDFGVSGRTVDKAVKVLEAEDEEIIGAVDRGEITVSAAAERVERPPAPADPLAPDHSLSQWFTPAELAGVVAELALRSNPQSVLEPAVGAGALLHAIDPDRDLHVLAYDVDPRWVEAARAEGWPCELVDYLEAEAPHERFDVVALNPPFEDSADGRFVAKAMDEGDLVVAVLRTAALCGLARHDQVWGRLDFGLTDLRLCIRRPSFGGGSPRHEFCVVRLERGYEGPTDVRWV